MINKTKFKRNIYLLKVLINRDIRAQYVGSILGVLWTVLNPLLNMCVIALVFSSIFGTADIGMDYAVYVLSGNIIFNFFRAGSEGALPSIVEQRDLLSKTQVPLWIIPMSRVGSSLVSFAFSFVALIIVMLIRIPAGITFHWEMIMIIALLPALFLFTTGFSLIMATFYVYFRDIKHFYSVILTLWMYLTPLFYSISTLNLGPTLVTLMHINPLYQFVTYFRNTLLGDISNWQYLLFCYAWGIGAFVIGFFIFEKKKNSLLLNA